MFIQNVGQFAGGALFQVRGADKTIWPAEDAIRGTVLEQTPAPPPYASSLRTIVDEGAEWAFRAGSWGQQLARAGGLALLGQNVELVGQIGGRVQAVAVQGGYAYIGVGPRLVVVDVSNPAAPRKVGETGVLPGVA